MKYLKQTLILLTVLACGTCAPEHVFNSSNPQNEEFHLTNLLHCILSDILCPDSTNATPEVLTVSVPGFSPVGGNYSLNQSVTLSTTPADGVTIVYTIDTSAPTVDTSCGALNGIAIASGDIVAVSTSQNIRAIACKADWNHSAEASAIYELQPANPVFSQPGGNYAGTPSITLSTTSSIDGAIIYYTIDGSVPTTGSTLYSSGIPTSLGMQIRAIAVNTGWTDSTVASSGEYRTNYKTISNGFNRPHGIAIDSSDNVFVVDSTNNRVQKFDNTLTFVTQWGSFGTADGQFRDPSYIAIDSANNVYVSEVSNSPNNRIQVFNNSGAYQSSWVYNKTGAGIAIDASDNVYVGDYGGTYSVHKYSSTGTVITSWGGAGTGNGQFSGIRDVCTDGTYIYVADSNHNRIQRFDTAGSFQGWLANGTTGWQMGSATGIAGSANGQFNKPRGVDVDSSGNLYVADTDNNRIQAFNSGGNFLKKWTTQTPYGVATDSSGNIYAADYYGNVIHVYR